MNTEDNETLRHAVLEVVAMRHPTAQAVRAIRRHAAYEVGFKILEEDVIAAAEFNVGMGYFTSAHDPLGSSKYYTATPDGVKAFERGAK